MTERPGHDWRVESPSQFPLKMGFPSQCSMAGIISAAILISAYVLRYWACSYKPEIRKAGWVAPGKSYLLNHCMNVEKVTAK